MFSSADAASSEVRSCIILAAGEGRRLSPLQNDCPKPGIEILGLSLGERSVAAGMAAGMRRFIVVLGSQAEAVRTHFEQVAARRGCTIEFVMAEDWKLGNGASALAVRNRIRSDPFLLVMADHLIAPNLIKQLLRTPPGKGEVCLAVDWDTERVFDPEDATKVRVEEALVSRIGKQLRTWNAVDTGVFLCTKALFDALERAAKRDQHALSDAVAELAQRGRVRAVDVTGEQWMDVDTPVGLQEVRRRLLKSIGKGSEDGYISTYINRRLSVRISALLARTSISPTQITVTSLVLALVGATFFTFDRYWAGVLGAILVQFSSIVDGCDGEIARCKYLATVRGAWLDTMLDRYADTAVTVAITLGYATSHPGTLTWLGGFVAITGFLLASYATKEFALRHGYSYPNDFLNRLKRRDARLFTICCGAFLGYPYQAMLAVGILSHVVVLGILFKGWRLKQEPA